MKKNLLTLVAVFLFAGSLYAQDAAKGTWELIVDSTGVSTGNVVVKDQFRTSDLEIKDYTGGAMLGGIGQRLRVNPWPGGETTRVASRYVQFEIAPKPGFDFTVTKISYYKAGSGTHGHMHANAWYDTDPGFANGVEFDTTGQKAGGDLPFGLPDARDRDCPMSEYTMNVLVKNGQSFFLRFYPWYSVASSSNSKYFILLGINIEGTTTVATAVENEILPTEFSLEQNYPNPFNPSTTLNFALPKSDNVTIKVFDQLGREVETLLNKEMSAGKHTLNWNAGNLASGIYFVQMRSADFVKSVKAILMK